MIRSDALTTETELSLSTALPRQATPCNFGCWALSVPCYSMLAFQAEQISGQTHYYCPYGLPSRTTIARLCNQVRAAKLVPSLPLLVRTTGPGRTVSTSPNRNSLDKKKKPGASGRSEVPRGASQRELRQKWNLWDLPSQSL